MVGQVITKGEELMPERACRDTLPTYANLFKRSLDVDMYYPRREEGFETITDLFLECDGSLEVWLKPLRRMDVSTWLYHDFED